MIHRIRGLVMPGLLLLSVLLWASGVLYPPARLGLFATLPLFALGLADLLQPWHSLLRNYPILGHLRFLLEDAGPELRQYIVEANKEGHPFDRDWRSLIYQRAKGEPDQKPFGTELDVYAAGYSWLGHSLAPHVPPADPVATLRCSFGGPECSRPYDASVFNISAMSFGALSGSAIRALNRGARAGDFAHNTGEGGISEHHRAEGGDLIWQVGTGYFGCRTPAGDFDAERFEAQARSDAVKMIEIKLSQGAKPGHGGILPGVKVSREIAAVRGVPAGKTCISPPGHSAFHTPIGLLQFVARLRQLSGGKPVGFKLCIGDPLEFMAVCRAMHETGLAPDFITVDGGEGGTGAAPVEFSDHVGMPGTEALVLVHNALVGIGVREHVRIIASAKLVTGFALARAAALGADTINSARGFMFALGCIQAQRCHTNRCPVGVATQNRWLQRALIVETKAPRVTNFHCKTVEAMAEVVAAVGFDHPAELSPKNVYQRVSPWEIRPLSALYPHVQPGALLGPRGGGFLRPYWEAANASEFRTQ